MAVHGGVLHLCMFSISIILLSYLSDATLADNDSRKNYIVHMDLSAMPETFSSHQNWYITILASITSNPETTPSSMLIYSYSHVMDGFSATLSPSEHLSLKKQPGYLSSYPDFNVTLHTTNSPHFLHLGPHAGAWPASDYGSDVIVGLVDTGIWPESQSYDDTGMSDVSSRWKGECVNGTQFDSSMCNKKLIGARYFNKGLLAQNPQANITMNSTRDDDGHGTHTSSTAAGSTVDGASYFGYATGSATGIAPRARVAMYKAFWPEGSVASDVIAAIDSAIEDGVDVLSLSFGYDEVALYEDPVAIATFAAMEKGIFVTSSAGNDGPYLLSLHNGTPWVITVAASTQDRDFVGVVTLGNQVQIIGTSLYAPDADFGFLPVVYKGRCDDWRKMRGSTPTIVVCEKKDDYFTLKDQLWNLIVASVPAGGVFITDEPRAASILHSTDKPAITISPENGQILKDYINNTESPKVSLKFKLSTVGTTRAPNVDTYSSRGPSQTCPHVLKPDVTAPGTLILAAWPSNIPAAKKESSIGYQLFSDYSLLTGTSMSCAHVAGAAVLIKGAHPDWSPAAVRSAIMTSSDYADNGLGSIGEIGDGNKVASPLAMGAGHINPNKALDPGLVYDVGPQDYVNLLCGLNFTQENIKAITRSSSYYCSDASLDLNYPSFIAYFNSNDSSAPPVTVREFQRTVTNVGEGPAIYQPLITPIEGFNVSVVPDTLVFEEQNEKLSYTLRIVGPTVMKSQVAFGHLVWWDKSHSVRSPIVITSLPSEPLPSIY